MESMWRFHPILCNQYYCLSKTNALGSGTISTTLTPFGIFLFNKLVVVSSKFQQPRVQTDSIRLLSTSTGYQTEEAVSQAEAES